MLPAMRQDGAKGQGRQALEQTCRGGGEKAYRSNIIDPE
jgi:hypothetical protein